VKDLANTEHVGNRQTAGCYAPFLGPVWGTQSHFDSEGWFSSDQVIFLTAFRAFWWKSIHHLSEKTQFPGFLCPQVVQNH